MPEYDGFAPHYDAQYPESEPQPDIPFFVELARESGSPVCELACGTGRILLPVARAGIDITGVDVSSDMLEVLAGKLAREPHEVQSRVALKCADMRSCRPSRRFRLVYCAFNSFLHLTTTDDQLACLDAVRGCLEPDGRLAISLFAPWHHRLVNRTETFQHTVTDPATGRPVFVQMLAERDLAAQTFDVTTLQDTTDADGTVRRATGRFTMCWIHHREMRLLLRHAGYAVEAVYGGPDRRPYDYVSGIQIFIARPAAS